MEALVVIAALFAVVLVLAWPLLRPRDAAGGRDAERIADLLAARESTYRQIRELELDHRTGKLSREDFRTQDRALRARAIEILRELDALGVSEEAARPQAERATATLPGQ